jgi:ABC-type transport system involved in multi-copper enzyme maturation permease subunit
MQVAAVPDAYRAVINFSAVVPSFILSSGLIGQDFSAGAVHLIFTRPIRRAEYVISRFAAASIVSAAAGILEIALVSLVRVTRGRDVNLSELGPSSLECIFAAIGICAAITLLSSVSHGLGDVVLFVSFTFVGHGLVLAAGLAKISWADILERWINALGFPSLQYAELTADRPDAWTGILTYVATLCAYLLLACLALHRRELTYA